MKVFEATEIAYKNGYEAGKKDALKWIPVSERLPEEWVDVLVLSKYGFVKWLCIWGFRGNGALHGIMTFLSWTALPTGCHFQNRQWGNDYG